MNGTRQSLPRVNASLIESFSNDRIYISSDVNEAKKTDEMPVK